MNSDFFGTWSVCKEKTCGADEFGQALGLTKEQMSLYESLDISVTVSQQGESYRFEVDFHGAAPPTIYVIKAEETTTISTIDGISCQMTLLFEEGAVVEKYEAEQGNWEVRRTVSGNEMFAVTKVGSATLTQTLIRVST